MEGPPGEIARLLYPQAEDLTLLKPRHSAFFASPLELLLKEMGARELVICGLATDICVQLTAMDAFLREYAAWVPAATAASLKYIADILRFDVTRASSTPAKKAGASRQSVAR